MQVSPRKLEAEAEVKMNDLAIFSVGHERSRWLSARVSATAANVANADTPNYKARDVAPFQEALSGAESRLGITQSRHLSDQPAVARKYEMLVRDQGGAKHSGNTVSIETEMANLGEARSQQAMVTGVMGVFHRLLLASSRS